MLSMPAELEDPVPRQLSAARCIQITRICCGIVIAIVATVLVGWSVDSILLKSMLPAAVAMKPNAAIALCFSALSLLFFTRPATRGAQLQQKLSVVFAIAVAAIGALTLFEYLTGVSLGIDELLFRDSVRSASPIYPAGRMAPIAAFNFVCMGHALLLIHRPKWILHAQGLTAVAACGSLLAVIGYLFGVEMLYRSGYFSAIAVNTGVAFLALCTGLWFATSGVGFMRVVTASGPSGTLVRRYGVTVLVLPFLISWLHLQGDHYVWFEPDFGSALFALIDVVTFSLLIWFGASSLHRSEAKEAEVRERLRHARLELEDRVHERTRALETALHVNQQIMNYSLDVICIIDAEGRFTTVSAACEKVWGYTPAELIGRRFIELVHPDDHEKTNQTAAGIVTGETVRDFENRYLRKDGSSVFVTWSVYWSAEQKRMFCVARDATERKRAEEALHQAREDAERANRAKSEFLANMSHEIRTPMNGILGMTELTLDTELNREQREYLGMVKTSAHSLLGVINDILDFSKIEAGKLEMEALSFSLRDTVGTMLKPLGVRADEKDLELVADIPRDVPDHLIGDPMRLRQILLNLTDNAIKFTQRGEVIIKAAVESAADGESELHFSVTDSGIGIPAEKQATIFEAFSQVDGSTTRHYGGTGLGLAIATRLVQQMRGRIWVESQLGCGTTFHFTIWLRTSATPLPMVQQIDPAGLDGLRVLIVDDNAVNCRILEEMLTNWDMQPVVVRSAPAALTVMRAAVSAGNPFPLVLLDAMMPGHGRLCPRCEHQTRAEPRERHRDDAVVSDALRRNQPGEWDGYS
jgi:PAS domain S-box-containing protein